MGWNPLSRQESPRRTTHIIVAFELHLVLDTMETHKWPTWLITVPPCDDGINLCLIAQIVVTPSHGITWGYGAARGVDGVLDIECDHEGFRNLKEISPLVPRAAWRGDSTSKERPGCSGGAHHDPSLGCGSKKPTVSPTETVAYLRDRCHLRCSRRR